MALEPVNVTAGSGTPIACDLDGSGNYHQAVKTSLGKDGTFTGLLGGDTTPESDFTAYSTIRPKSATQEQASAGLTAAATAYTLGDTLGTGWTFTSMARSAGGIGRITGVRVYDKADVVTSITLYLYSVSVTFGTDNSAPSISDADQANFIAAISLGFTDLGASRVASLDSCAIRYHCAATSLFVYAVTNAAHTFFGAVGDLPIRLYYELD